jgi:putative hydrolase of the HAD superfamily
MTLPRAILFDLDDTLISAYAQPELAWLAIAGEFARELRPIPEHVAAAAIAEASDAFWGDAERHRQGRLNLLDARTSIVAEGFAALARNGHDELPDDLARAMAERYATYRDEQMYLFTGAHDLVDELKTRGVKLALITNGAGPAQRAKIERFELVHRFDHIQIEGEHGFGKPEERAYLHAMEVLGVAPHETWMVGDNLEWEIEAPQRLGIYAIWHDAIGKGLPPGSKVRPDRIIRSLVELMPRD